jgi:hypothetical protein
VRVKEVFRFDGASGFAATILKPGQPSLAIHGSFKFLPQDAFMKKVQARYAIMLVVDLETARKMGMPVRQLRLLQRLREKTAVLSKLLLFPEVPALTDLRQVLLAPKGMEAKARSKYPALRLRLARAR